MHYLDDTIDNAKGIINLDNIYRTPGDQLCNYVKIKLTHRNLSTHIKTLFWQMPYIPSIASIRI